MTKPKPSDIIDVEEKLNLPEPYFSEDKSPLQVLDTYLTSLETQVGTFITEVQNLNFNTEDEVALKLFKKDIAYYNNIVKVIDRTRIDTIAMLTAPIKDYDVKIKQVQDSLKNTIDKINVDRKKYEVEQVNLQRNAVLLTIQKLLDDMELPEIKADIVYKDSHRGMSKKAFNNEMSELINMIKYNKSTMVDEVYKLYITHLDPLKALNDYEFAKKILAPTQPEVVAPKVENVTTISYVTIKVTPQDLELIKKLNIDFIEVI